MAGFILAAQPVQGVFVVAENRAIVVRRPKSSKSGDRLVHKEKAQGPFLLEVENRFGLVPNFFVSSPDAPEVVEKLWEFAKAAYLDGPLPSLFKERLFVFLSRFCEVRYCVVRHCGFLVGYGNVAGDSTAPPQTIEDVIELLKAPSPWQRPLEPIYERVESLDQLNNWPDPRSDLEDYVFALAAIAFVTPRDSGRAREALRRALGGRRLDQLLAYLAFIRTAHYWTVVHPGLEIEDDMMELLAEQVELAALLLREPDTK